MTKVELGSNERGKHSELLAQMALTANGYQVLLPGTDSESYDMAIRVGKETMYIQVKTAYWRTHKRYNGAWLTVRGRKNSGKVYSKSEVDYFIMVWENKCYMFPNREIQEYWFREHELHEKTLYLEADV